MEVENIKNIKCNICHQSAEFIIMLESNNSESKYDYSATGGLKNDYTITEEEIPFYLCKQHEYLYDKMRNKYTNIMTLFSETINEYK